MAITYTVSDWGSNGWIVNPARGQLNGEIEISLSLFAPDNLVYSRDRFGRPVPRQPAHLSDAYSYARVPFLPPANCDCDYYYYY